MKNNGGPAFPLAVAMSGQRYNEGMTLRDYFAAKAIPEAIRHQLNVRASMIERGTFDFGMVAETAYMMADAMLKERAK